MLMRMIGIALFLGTIGLVLVGFATVVFGAVAGRVRLVQGTAVFLVLWLAAYGVLVAASPLLYPPRVLAPGAERAFCGLDCHLKLAVTDVRVDRSRSDALRYRLRLRVRSDAVREPEQPSALMLEIVDDHGRRWPLLPPEARGLGRGPLARPVWPGESYEATVAVDLPRDVVHPRLAAWWGGTVGYLVPFAENTLVLRRTTQSLAMAGQGSGM